MLILVWTNKGKKNLPLPLGVTFVHARHRGYSQLGENIGNSKPRKWNHQPKFIFSEIFISQKCYVISELSFPSVPSVCNDQPLGERIEVRGQSQGNTLTEPSSRFDEVLLLLARQSRNLRIGSTGGSSSAQAHAGKVDRGGKEKKTVFPLPDCSRIFPLKQSGMEWSIRGANAFIALRCVFKSGRLEDYSESRTI